MLLSEIVGKDVYSGKNLKGVCRGVCISLKSRAVKYILCSTRKSQDDAAEFSVNVSCIETIGDTVLLKRMRTAVPKNCARFFTDRPVYSEEGTYLGKTADLLIENYTAIKLITDTDGAYAASAIAALGDAVILHRPPVFPLGMNAVVDISAGEEIISAGMPITRGTLRTAISAGKLIELTLSLLPKLQENE